MLNNITKKKRRFSKNKNMKFFNFLPNGHREVGKYLTNCRLCCGSVTFWYGSADQYPWPVLRIRDVYPGSRILIFTHPGSRISDPGSKYSNKRVGWNFFFVISFNVNTKIVTKLSKIWVWDPGSEIRKKPIPDPDPQHCIWLTNPDPDPAVFVSDLQDGN